MVRFSKAQSSDDLRGEPRPPPEQALEVGDRIRVATGVGIRHHRDYRECGERHRKISRQIDERSFDAERTARVAEVLAHAGTQVEAGDLLIRLEDPPAS